MNGILRNLLLTILCGMFSVPCTHGGTIYGVAFSPDGKILASGSQDNTVNFWDPRTGECTRTFRASLSVPKENNWRSALATR
jgi:WD40 repeat protein